MTHFNIYKPASKNFNIGGRPDGHTDGLTDRQPYSWGVTCANLCLFIVGSVQIDTVGSTLCCTYKEDINASAVCPCGLKARLYFRGYFVRHCGQAKYKSTSVLQGFFVRHCGQAAYKSTSVLQGLFCPTLWACYIQNTSIVIKNGVCETQARGRPHYL